MKNIKKIILFSIATLISTATLANTATTVADVANSVKSHIVYAPLLITYTCYTIGVFLMVQSALKLKDHTESKGQIKLSQPIIYAIVGVLMVSIPTVIFRSQESLSYKTLEPKPVTSTKPTPGKGDDL